MLEKKMMNKNYGEFLTLMEIYYSHVFMMKLSLASKELYLQKGKKSVLQILLVRS